MIIHSGSGGGRGRSLSWFFMPGNVFSPVPLHRDYLLRLCARDGIASSIIIIIRRFASSLFAGCGGFWRLPTPSTGPLPRLHADVSGVFGTSSARRPSSLRSATSDASLPSSPVTFLLFFAGSLFVGSSLLLLYSSRPCYHNLSILSPFAN